MDNINDKTCPEMKTYQKKGFIWINVTKPSQNCLSDLKTSYPFLLDIDLRDCLPPFQRPKLMERDQYLFLVLTFPVFNKSSRIIEAAEMDVFVGQDFIITSHDNRLQPLIDAALKAEEPAEEHAAEVTHGVIGWMHQLLSGLMLGVYPMVTHIINDVNNLERSLIEDTDGAAVRDILRVKTNVVEIRRVMQGHKHVMEKFMALAPRITNFNGMEVYYEDLVGHTKEIWDSVQNERETIEAVTDTYMSRVSYETGEASKTLTALAFIIFPMTLVAAIFAMRAEHMPFIGLPGDFWLMLGCVLTVAVGTIAYLRKRNWL